MGSEANRGIFARKTSANLALEQRVEQALQSRLDSSEYSYSTKEIDRIAGLDSRLFPADFMLDKQTSEQMRALAMLTRCELRANKEISSHRPLAGPVIVAVKKLLWRMMRVHLDDAFKGLQEFCSWSVTSQAQSLVKIQRLEAELRLLQAEEPK